MFSIPSLLERANALGERAWRSKRLGLGRLPGRLTWHCVVGSAATMFQDIQHFQQLSEGHFQQLAVGQAGLGHHVGFKIPGAGRAKKAGKKFDEKNCFPHKTWYESAPVIACESRLRLRRCCVPLAD